MRIFTTPVGDQPAVMFRISVEDGPGVYRRIAEWTFPNGVMLRNGKQILLEVLESRREHRPR